MKKMTIDPPEIVYPPSPEHPWVRRKFVCMSLTDWTLFGDALAEALPDAIYIRGLTSREEYAAERPIIQAERHLCSAREPDPEHPDGVSFPGEIEMYVDPKAELKVGQSSWPGVSKRATWYATAGLSWPRIRFLPRAMAHPADERPAVRAPERRSEGEIQIYVEPHDKGHARFMRQIFRLLAQFATDEWQTLVRYPHYDLSPVQRLGFRLWIGHDALRWAREDPKRLLAYQPSPLSRRTPDYMGSGYRPKEP